MDSSIYELNQKLENEHWWFRGRRRICKHFLDTYLKKNSLKILEIGCGTGGNLKFLSTYGDVSAFEPNDYAVTQSTQLNVGTIKGSLPNDNPFEGETFDVIAAFDVLEHIENDTIALDCIYKMLKKEGLFIATVPALKFMWSFHDEKHHHFRRYTQQELMNRFAPSLWKKGKM